MLAAGLGLKNHTTLRDTKIFRAWVRLIVAPLRPVHLGDDRFACQPMAEAVPGRVVEFLRLCHMPATSPMPEPMSRVQKTPSTRPVYFYHLRKCGGSSLNHWLDTQVPDIRAWDGTLLSPLYGYFSWERATPDPPAFEAAWRCLGTSAFFAADIVHSHIPLLPYAPGATFCFTMLREPASRVLSQISDWRRLMPFDRAKTQPAMQQCLSDAIELRVAAFLAKHAGGIARQLVDNYMVRALAANRLGRQVLATENASGLLEIALETLETKFDLVGIAERDFDTRNCLSAALGWAPSREIARINDSGSSQRLGEEIDEARSIVNDITREDAKLYARARQLFDQKLKIYVGYDNARFEATTAACLCQRLEASVQDGIVSFSVRQPLIGSGFQGRDSAGAPHCAVWTGPGALAYLYMPIPPDRDLTVFLWIRGYAQIAQRDNLRIRVDGREIPHRLEPAAGYADRLAIDIRSPKNFLRLDIDVGTTATTGQPGTPGFDARLKGVAFDRYGWIVR